MILSRRNPIILIHGLWNTADIFSSITSKLDERGIEYFAPTLKHKYGMKSIVELTYLFNELILEKYGIEKELDILGFSMGGIIGRYWIKKMNGYKRTRRFITVGSPHKGTLASQLVPKYPFSGISEMKINSLLLRDLSKYDYLLSEINCISFFTYWDLMVFPGWRASLNSGEKISLKIYKHKNLIRNTDAVEKIIERLLN
tara:strand:- start:3991 stop:4590 length:600 start_codon:yes stop_codon:yes gene_type:complete